MTALLNPTRRPVLLTTGMVAAMLGVSRRTVINWCEQGRLVPAQWDGHQWQIARNFLPPRHYMHKLDRNVNKPPGPGGRPVGSGGRYPKGTKRPGRTLANQLRRQQAQQAQQEAQK